MNGSRRTAAAWPRVCCARAARQGPCVRVHVACGMWGALVSGLSVPAQAPRLWPASGLLSKGGMERRAAAAGNALLPTAAALMAAKDSRAAESGAGLVYLRCATGPQGQEAPQDERGVKRDRNEERGRVEIQSRYKDGQRGRGRQLACHDHMRAPMASDGHAHAAATQPAA